MRTCSTMLALVAVSVLALGAAAAQAGVEIYVGDRDAASDGRVQVFDGDGVFLGTFISTANGAADQMTLTAGPDGKAYQGVSVGGADDIYAKPVSQIDGAAPTAWNTSSLQYDMTDGKWASDGKFYMTGRSYSGGYYDGVLRYDPDGSEAGNGTDPQPLWLRDDANLGPIDYASYDYTISPCEPTTRTFSGAPASIEIATVDIGGTPTELIYLAHRNDKHYYDHDNADNDCDSSTGREYVFGDNNGKIFRYKMDGTPYGAGGSTSDPLLIDPATDPNLNTGQENNVDIEVIDGKLYVLNVGNGATATKLLRYDAVSGAAAGQPGSETDSKLLSSGSTSLNGPNGEIWMNYCPAMETGPDGNLYILSRGYQSGYLDYNVLKVGDDGTGTWIGLGAKDVNGKLIAPLVDFRDFADEASGYVDLPGDLFVIPEPATLGLLGLGGLGLLIRRRRR